MITVTIGGSWKLPEISPFQSKSPNFISESWSKLKCSSTYFQYTASSVHNVTHTELMKFSKNDLDNLVSLNEYSDTKQPTCYYRNYKS